MQRESQQSLLRDAADRRRREREIERQKYEEYLTKDRRKVEQYKLRKAEKKAGLRPGIREKSDGICCVM